MLGVWCLSNLYLFLANISYLFATHYKCWFHEKKFGYSNFFSHCEFLTKILCICSLQIAHTLPIFLFFRLSFWSIRGATISGSQFGLHVTFYLPSVMPIFKFFWTVLPISFLHVNFHQPNVACRLNMVLPDFCTFEESTTHKNKRRFVTIAMEPIGWRFGKKCYLICWKQYVRQDS